MALELIYRCPTFALARAAVLELDRFPRNIVTGISYFRLVNLHIVAVVTEGNHPQLEFEVEEILNRYGKPYPSTLEQLITEKWDACALGDATMFMKAMR